MVVYYIFVERAGKAEIMNAMLDEGYSILDWSFMVIDSIEKSGGTEMTCEFDTKRNAENFIYELEIAGFEVEVL